MSEEIDITEEMDLKGEVCPYTFVKSKLALEMMESGEVLKVIVDHLPAVDNVPRSLQNEGHKVVDISQINDSDWSITVKKA